LTSPDIGLDDIGLCENPSRSSPILAVLIVGAALLVAIATGRDNV